MAPENAYTAAREAVAKSVFSYKDIAARVGCRPETITRLMHGSKKVSHSLCRKILAACTPQGTPPSPAAVDTRGQEPGSSERMPSTPANSPAPAPAREQTLQEITAATMATLQARLAAAGPDAAPTLVNSLLNAVKLLGRLTGQLEISEAAIIRSPAGRRIVEAIADALTPYPDALAAALEALRTLKGEPSSNTPA